MNFVKKIITILIVLLTTISFAKSEEQIVYLDLDKIVSNTKAGKLIIDELKKSKDIALSKFEVSFLFIDGIITTSKGDTDFGHFILSLTYFASINAPTNLETPIPYDPIFA